MEKEKVGINIYHTIPIEGNLKEILYGIEEEGLLWITSKSTEESSKVLGGVASSTSKLGVGIGIGTDGITLSYEKLSVEKPLFTNLLDDSKKDLRLLGMNGARLIKGEPFIIPKGDE